MQPHKVTCEYCKRKFQPDRLKVHLRYFCGPAAKKSVKQAKQLKKRTREGISKQTEEAADDDAADADKDDAMDADEAAEPEQAGEAGQADDSSSNKQKDGAGEPSSCKKKEQPAAIAAAADAKRMIDKAMKGKGRQAAGTLPLLHQVAWRRIVLDEVRLESAWQRRRGMLEGVASAAAYWLHKTHRVHAHCMQHVMQQHSLQQHSMHVWHRHTPSRTVAAALPRPCLRCVPATAGLSVAPLCKTGLGSCTASSASWPSTPMRTLWR